MSEVQQGGSEVIAAESVHVLVRDVSSKVVFGLRRLASGEREPVHSVREH